jgi:hypothetical protein
MSFLLYDLRTENSLQTHFLFRSSLRGRTSLWGADGIVARSVRGKRVTEGPWCLTEREILTAIPSSDPDRTAILDDLVPKGPETRVGRILEIKGVLDPPFCADQNERYNPILITMEEVLSLPPNTRRPDVQDVKRVIPVPDPPGIRLRSVNYLWRSWMPPGAFRGALLTDDHWRFLIS